MQANLQALLLIDRDGCLIAEKEYLSDPAGVELLPRAAEALRLLESEGIARIVCSNQSGVARGFFGIDAVERVHARLGDLLAREGARLDGIYYSPELADAVDPSWRSNLHRRKPGRGMYEEAVRDHPELADLPVYAIGDRMSDIDFGIACGGRSILVQTGYGQKETEAVRAKHPQVPIASGLYQGAAWLLTDLLRRQFPGDATYRRKLLAAPDLVPLLRQHQAAGRKVVFANGCFDLLHAGHISFLEDARAAGDVLVLAVNSNASIRRLKGAGRPVLAEASRLQLLAALQAVDYLTVFHEDSADASLEELRPDFHAKGTDYTATNVPEAASSRRLGIKTIITGNPKENSTRDIITTVRERARAGML